MILVFHETTINSIYRVGLKKDRLSLEMSSGNCTPYDDLFIPQKHKVHTVTETGCICFQTWREEKKTVARHSVQKSLRLQEKKKESAPVPKRK